MSLKCKQKHEPLLIFMNILTVIKDERLVIIYKQFNNKNE